MWLSRWLTSKPQKIARSIWARHSLRTSSRSAWSQTSSTVREAAVAVEQARRVGDRAPPVVLPLGVQREVHADVLAPVLGRARHAPTGTGTISVALVATPLRSASYTATLAERDGAEVVAVDDQQLGAGRIAESFGEGGHCVQATGRPVEPVSRSLRRRLLTGARRTPPIAPRDRVVTHRTPSATAVAAGADQERRLSASAITRR